MLLKGCDGAVTTTTIKELLSLKSKSSTDRVLVRNVMRERDWRAAGVEVAHSILM